jgi:uncharacterized repeat protein (TIGR03803 family)
MKLAIDQIFSAGISRGMAVLAVTLFATLTATHPALAQTETILYNFCSLTGCADGSYPHAGLVMDASGNLYGATATGGAYFQGTVFKLTPDGTETVLHSFGSSSTDGLQPYLGALVMDSEGNLYGTTTLGGVYFNGTVYKVTPGGEETILYSFCATGGISCTDGWFPAGGVILDKAGNLYGTTSRGGSTGAGVVFKLSPSGTETVLYNFTGGSDGGGPEAGVVIDGEGNLYGTTFQGGFIHGCKGIGCGVVFKLAPDGTETVLHSFGSANDGSEPWAGVILAKNGDLYGTTYSGGANLYGTVFRVSPSGTERILYSFKAGADDGGLPWGPVIIDSAGNLYGTTYIGGSDSNAGTVYEISSTGTESLLHSFSETSEDGYLPIGGLLLDSAGNLYGTTSQGGSSSSSYAGTVFKVTP